MPPGEVQKARFPHAPDGLDAPGDTHANRFGQLFGGLIAVSRYDFGDAVALLERMPVRRVAEAANLPQPLVAMAQFIF
jgi:hypothetical protein